jgi:hypothetical protein
MRKALVVRSLFGAVNGAVLFALFFCEWNTFLLHQGNQLNSKYTIYYFSEYHTKNQSEAFLDGIQHISMNFT